MIRPSYPYQQQLKGPHRSKRIICSPKSIIFIIKLNWLFTNQTSHIRIEILLSANFCFDYMIRGFICTYFFGKSFKNPSVVDFMPPLSTCKAWNIQALYPDMHHLCTCQTKTHCSFLSMLFCISFLCQGNGALIFCSHLEACTSHVPSPVHDTCEEQIGQNPHQENNMVCIFGLCLLRILSLVQIISWRERNHLLGPCQISESLRLVSTKILHKRFNSKKSQLLSS